MNAYEFLRDLKEAIQFLYYSIIVNFRGA
jgi:hypothetical protein